MCIVPQEVSESQHRALKMEVSTLQTENKLLKDKYSMAQGKDFNCNRRFFRYLFPSNKMKAALEEFWGGGIRVWVLFGEPLCVAVCSLTGLLLPSWLGASLPDSGVSGCIIFPQNKYIAC